MSAKLTRRLNVNYDQAVAYILQIPKFTSKRKLSDTISFLKELGNPEKDFKVIHVAGTNGKGSVCLYLDTLLQAEGKTVGRFTSPHLERINERIVISGKEVSDDEFVESFNQVCEVVKEMEAKGMPHPTFFEFIFGMSLLAFRAAKVEYVVLETGLGGRLDATNSVAHPIATIITSIGYDHMKQLGNTLGKIAYEKAGIIKEGVPLIFVGTTEESDDVIENRAKALISPWVKVTRENIHISKVVKNGIAFSIKTDYYGKGLWTLNNIGVYQPYNALLAIETMRILFGEKKSITRIEDNALSEKGFWDCRLNEKQVNNYRQALAKAVFKGRMEEIKEGVYLDGAHNINAIIGFTKSVSNDPSGKIIVFGAVADKDVESMIRELIAGLATATVEMIIVTEVMGGRAVGCRKLKLLFEKYTDKPVLIVENPHQAVDYALKLQGNSKIYCLGSLYLIGEISKGICRQS
jgi:dihydrofolate synthase/folylpolyglutamate synthase